MDYSSEKEIYDLKRALIEIHKNKRPKISTCDEWFCGTCGGAYNRIIRHMDLQTSNKISKVLKSINMINELYMLGDLEYVFVNVDRKGYISMLIRVARNFHLDWLQKHQFISRVVNLGHYENDELDLLCSKIEKIG